MLKTARLSFAVNLERRYGRQRGAAWLRHSHQAKHHRFLAKAAAAGRNRGGRVWHWGWYSSPPIQSQPPSCRRSIQKMHCRRRDKEISGATYLTLYQAQRSTGPIKCQQAARQSPWRRLAGFKTLRHSPIRPKRRSPDGPAPAATLWGMLTAAQRELFSRSQRSRSGIGLCIGSSCQHQHASQWRAPVSVVNN